MEHEDIYPDGFERRPVWKYEIEGAQPLKLLQGQSGAVADEDATVGKYYIDGIGELEDNLVVLPLDFTKTRSLSFLDDETQEFETLCYSNDMIHGWGEPGGICDTCPMSMWGEKKSPPKCTESHHYLLYIPEYQIFATWALRKVSIKTSKLIQNLSSIRGLQNTPLVLNSKKEKSGQWTYWVPLVKRLAPTAENKEMIEGSLAELKTYMEQLTQKQLPEEAESQQSMFQE